jgi:hypothetical protein
MIRSTLIALVSFGATILLVLGSSATGSSLV